MERPNGYNNHLEIVIQFWALKSAIILEWLIMIEEKRSTLTCFCNNVKKSHFKLKNTFHKSENGFDNHIKIKILIFYIYYQHNK